jgi:hypothetical protein
MAAHVLSRLRTFFYSDTLVPEEEDRHREANLQRELRAQELRKCLEEKPPLEKRIDAITSDLLDGVVAK